jgi:hypothetical protein
MRFLATVIKAKCRFNLDIPNKNPTLIEKWGSISSIVTSKRLSVDLNFSSEIFSIAFNYLMSNKTLLSQTGVSVIFIHVSWKVVLKKKDKGLQNFCDPLF